MSTLPLSRIDEIFGNRRIVEQVREIQLRQAKLYKDGLDHVPKTMDIPSNIDYIFTTNLDQFSKDLEETYEILQLSATSKRRKYRKKDEETSLLYTRELITYNKIASIFIIKSLPQQKKDFFYMKIGALTDRIRNILNDISIIIRQVVLIDDKDFIPVELKNYLRTYALYNIILRQILDKKISPIGISDIEAEENKIIGMFGSDVMRLLKTYKDIDRSKNQNLQKVLRDVEAEIGRQLTDAEVKKYGEMYRDNLIKADIPSAPSSTVSTVPSSTVPSSTVSTAPSTPVLAPNLEDFDLFGEGLKKKYEQKMDKIQKKRDKLKHDAIVPYDPRYGKNNF